MLNFIEVVFCLAFFYYFADVWMIIAAIALGLLAVFLTRYSKKLQAKQDQKESFVTYADTCPDDHTDYGPEGSVIWGPRTIEENICINGKWYINENSEEWEENEE